MSINHLLKKFSKNKSRIFDSFLIISLFLLVLFVLFYKLDKPPLQAWDEGTNYRVVQESINRKDWWNLTLDNSPFFEKPPLWYWFTIITTKIWGLDLFSLRIVSAVSGLILVITIYYLSRKLNSFKGGLFSVLGIIGTHQLFQNSFPDVFSTHSFRSGDLDSLQLVFIMLETAFLFKSLKYRKYFYLTLIFLTLAFLTKGPFAFLPLIIFIVYLILNNKLRSFFNKKLIVYGTVLLLILILPWHIYQFLRYGNSFLNDYFYYHILGRSISVLENHHGSLFHYLKILISPEYFFSFGLLVGSIYLSFKYKIQTIKSNFILFSAIYGSIFTFMLLSFIQTKLSWYIFYVFPFCFISLGIIADKKITGKKTVYLCLISLLVPYSISFGIKGLIGISGIIFLITVLYFIRKSYKYLHLLLLSVIFLLSFIQVFTTIYSIWTL